LYTACGRPVALIASQSLSTPAKVERSVSTATTAAPSALSSVAASWIRGSSAAMTRSSFEPDPRRGTGDNGELAALVHDDFQHRTGFCEQPQRT
jgi:hypothetical protein